MPPRKSEPRKSDASIAVAPAAEPSPSSPQPLSEPQESEAPPKDKKDKDVTTIEVRPYLIPYSNFSEKAAPTDSRCLGPHTPQINHHETRQRRITAQHADSSQCRSGDKQIRHCIH